MKGIIVTLALLPGVVRADMVPLRLDADRNGGTATIQFETGEIASATVEPDGTGELALRVKLHLARWDDLRLFTSDAVGHETIVTVCGRELARPEVMMPLESGVFLLTGLDPEAEHRAAAMLTGTAPCEWR